MTSRSFVLFSIGVLLVTGVNAQQNQGGPGTGTSRPTTPTTPRTPTTPDRNRFPSDTNMPQMQQGPTYISGRILMDDGSPVPLNVVIEKICNGRPIPLGYADRKGHFGVRLSGANSAMTDASYDSSAGDDRNDPFRTGNNNTSFGGTRGQSLIGCDLRASYPGYRSDVYYLGALRSLDNPDVGTLVLHRLSEAPGRVISATSLSAPKDAQKAYEKGMDQARKGKMDDAETSFRKAVDLHPTYATAWYELGRLMAKKNPVEAQSFLRKALEADSRFVLPYTTLVALVGQEQKWQETAQLADRAIGLDPMSFPQLHFYSAVAHFNMKELDQAERSARQAIKLDTAHSIPKTSQLLGYILAQKGDLEGAAREFRDFIAANPTAPDTEKTKQALAQVEQQLSAKNKN